MVVDHLSESSMCRRRVSSRCGVYPWNSQVRILLGWEATNSVISRPTARHRTIAITTFWSILGKQISSYTSSFVVQCARVSSHKMPHILTSTWSPTFSRRPGSHRWPHLANPSLQCEGRWRIAAWPGDSCIMLHPLVRFRCSDQFPEFDHVLLLPDLPVPCHGNPGKRAWNGSSARAERTESYGCTAVQRQKQRSVPGG